MRSPKGRVLRAHTAGCLTGIVLLTGCSLGTPSYEGPSSWPAMPASGDFSSAQPTTSSSRSAAPDSTTWQLQLNEPGDPNVSPTAWPDPKTALSGEQLKKAFPEASDIAAPTCTKLTLPGGTPTAGDARCTWSISFPDSSAKANTITLSLLGFGADAPMTKQWVDDRRRQITGKLASDTFFAEGTFGAKGSYFLSNMHSALLLSDGEIAAWVELDFSGFYQVFENNSGKTLTGIRDQVFPVLAKDLVARLPRGAEGEPMSPTPATS